MLLLVCFRCIQVLTPEEIHNCLPSDDDEGGNDWLLVDYDPPRFKQGSNKPRREASIQTRGGGFNFLPSNRSASMNDYFSFNAPYRYANSSAEYSSRLAPNRQSKTETSDESLNLLGQNRSLSEHNPRLQLQTFVNKTFNERPENERVRTLDDWNMFSASRKLYQDFAKYSAARDTMYSSQTATWFYSSDLEKNARHILTTNRHLESDVLNVNMQKNTRVKRNISSTPLHHKRSKPSTSGYIPKYSKRTDPAPRQAVNSSQPSSGDESRKSIPSENMPKKT